MTKMVSRDKPRTHKSTVVGAEGVGEGKCVVLVLLAVSIPLPARDK